MNVSIVLVLVTLALGISAAEQKLEFVTFVHRHGDRSPAGTYPTDPYSNYPWNNGWGELTTAGKQTAFKLGEWFRTRYIDFLPKIYRKDDYQVQSTDMSRTLMSAYLVLAGLFEPTESDVWNPRIRWQPIPVHTIPQKLDNVLAAMKPCPKQWQLFTNLLLSSEISQMLHPFAADMEEIIRHAGYNTTNTLVNFLSVAQVYDSLRVQHENGLVLPAWTQAYFPEPMRTISSFSLRLRTLTPALQRLSCGPLVKEILHHFKEKMYGLLNKKVWHYSAHDITIVGLRQCLGFRETDTPPYGSAFILELISENENYFVKITYKAQDALTTLVMPGCTEYCPIQKFEELVRPIIPENWEAECVNDLGKISQSRPAAPYKNFLGKTEALSIGSI